MFISGRFAASAELPHIRIRVRAFVYGRSMPGQRKMFQPAFQSLRERMTIVGLTDREVAFLLSMSRERYDEISTPASHRLTFRESSAITDLSSWLGSLMTILEPRFVRDWLFLPGLGSDRRSPAEVIASGEAGFVEEYVERVNDKWIQLDDSLEAAF